MVKRVLTRLNTHDQLRQTSGSTPPRIRQQRPQGGWGMFPGGVPAKSITAAVFRGGSRRWGCRPVSRMTHSGRAKSPMAHSRPSEPRLSSASSGQGLSWASGGAFPESGRATVPDPCPERARRFRRRLRHSRNASPVGDSPDVLNDSFRTSGEMNESFKTSQRPLWREDRRLPKSRRRRCRTTLPEPCPGRVGV